jgi:hypothetical protein
LGGSSFFLRCWERRISAGPDQARPAPQGRRRLKKKLALSSASEVARLRTGTASWGLGGSSFFLRCWEGRFSAAPDSPCRSGPSCLAGRRAGPRAAGRRPPEASEKIGPLFCMRGGASALLELRAGVWVGAPFFAVLGGAFLASLSCPTARRAAGSAFKKKKELERERANDQ